MEAGRSAHIPLARFVESVASHASLEQDNSRLASRLAEEAAERERFTHEMELVRQVQQSLLPSRAPDVPGLECAGLCRPAFVVGGDCYDFFSLPGGRFAFTIGDISGKGLAAALLMASLQAFLRAVTLDALGDLTSLMERLNRLLLTSTGMDRYATLFYAQYDPARRELTWVNAGQNPPLLFQARGIRTLDEGGPVIGMLPSAEYEQASTRLEEGDLLLAYTDGITEAMNPSYEEWGETRLRAAVTHHNSNGRAQPLATLLERLLECADGHAAGLPQRDDMTLVALRAMPNAISCD